MHKKILLLMVAQKKITHNINIIEHIEHNIDFFIQATLHYQNKLIEDFIKSFYTRDKMLMTSLMPLKIKKIISKCILKPFNFQVSFTVKKKKTSEIIQDKLSKIKIKKCIFYQNSSTQISFYYLSQCKFTENK